MKSKKCVFFPMINKKTSFRRIWPTLYIYIYMCVCVCVCVCVLIRMGLTVVLRMWVDPMNFFGPSTPRRAPIRMGRLRSSHSYSKFKRDGVRLRTAYSRESTEFRLEKTDEWQLRVVANRQSYGWKNDWRLPTETGRVTVGKWLTTERSSWRASFYIGELVVPSAEFTCAVSLI